MPIGNEESTRIHGISQVERLQSEGKSAIERGDDANFIADKLLRLSQRTSDATVSKMAMLAHEGISSGQLTIAAQALASVSDQIASATNTFNLAARIAREGKESLTFPYIAGKAASLLDFLKALEKTVKDTVDQVDEVSDLVEAFESAKLSVSVLKEKAEALSS